MSKRFPTLGAVVSVKDRKPPTVGHGVRDDAGWWGDEGGYLTGDWGDG